MLYLNTHNELRGNVGIDARGEALPDVIKELRLIVINNGSEAFNLVGVGGSVLDLIFASPGARSCVLWCLERDSKASDHFPMRLISALTSPYECRSHRRPNWGTFLSELNAIQQCHKETGLSMRMSTVLVMTTQIIVLKS